MTNKTKILAVLLLLAATSMAQTDPVTQTQFETGTSGFAMEIGNSWQTLAVMALIISVAIVAIGYAVGIGFELPEIRAWAGSELVQIVTNAIILLALLAAIAFVDAVVIAIVMNSNLPLTCSPGESCLQKVANAYLSDYVSTASTGAKAVLVNNIKAAAAANRRVGGTCLTIWCLQAGFTTTVAGEKVLDQDYYAIIFEYYTNLLSFMEAQKFFVAEISFKMAPVVLAIGIVARSFFFTRKIGGLLMAVAIGAIFFFPGMYVFDWVTLDMALNGDKIMDTMESDCPEECGKVAPLAYFTLPSGASGTLNSTTDVAAAFSTSTPADGLLNGSWATATGSATRPAEVDPADWTGSVGDVTKGRTIYSCYCDSTKTTCSYGTGGKCPAACRELPYPYASPSCASLENQTYCAQLPLACKVIRYVPGAANDPEYSKCPASCKVVPPLKSDCRGTNSKCATSRFDCRVASRNDLTKRPLPPAGTPEPQKTACLNASGCAASLIAENSCVYVMPETGTCGELCAGCPVHCRILGQVDRTHPGPMGNVNLANVPSECKNTAGDALSTACMTCIDSHDSCAVNLTSVTAIAPVSPSTSCSNCPVEKRLLYSGLPEEYTSGGCSMENCPVDYRATLPQSTCEACLFTEETYTYSPPINTKCGDTCAPSSNVPASSPGDYTKIGGSGLVGKPEIQDIAKLMLPVYILPLFNIVATLVFIKSLSGFLGGDVEIPGLSKVF